VEVQEDGLIKVEVLEEHLGGKFSEEELGLISGILSDQIENFLKEQGDSGLEKLQNMRLPSAQEILRPGFSLSQKYGENLYK
jgi:hypothetical protein